MIQSNDLPMTVLTKRLGVTVETTARWKHRNSVEDWPHTPHRLKTTLSAHQEAIVLALRKTLELSLHDLLAVVREFIHEPLGPASDAQAAWRLEAFANRDTQAQGQALQGLRARLCAYRREVPATNGR